MSSPYHQYILACRDAGRELLKTARRHKRWAGTDEEVARLVAAARWHWHRYVRGLWQ